MNESTKSLNSCPKCGVALPAAMTDGLCPRCLMAEAMVPTQTNSDSSSPQQTLALAELAPHFPQLDILECLGRGGMGVVYKARQKSLNRLVALKLLAPERVGDPQFAERFTREAQALAALNHPNIVTIYDFGQAGGFYYLLMEFVDGVNLRQAMKAGRFTPEQALAIVPPVCEALQYAHEHGIVHRDIKPENLLLDKTGRVMIADFGVAKMLNAESPDASFVDSQPAGTPQYMAPEQKDRHRTDHRADIYSLGVVLYELLTGELPGKPLEAPSKRVVIDVRLDEIVLRALESKPELRYQTAGEMRTQVETIVSTPAGVKTEDSSQKSVIKSLHVRLRNMVVGRRGGKAVINWSGVARVFLLVFAIIVTGGALLCRMIGAPMDMRALVMGAMYALMTTGIILIGARRTPLDRLVDLDAPQVPIIGKDGGASFQSLEKGKKPGEPGERSGNNGRGLAGVRHVAGGIILLLAVAWTLLSHDIAAILFAAPLSENLFRPDKVVALAISLGLFSIGGAVMCLRKGRVARVVLATFVLWLLLVLAVLWSGYMAAARAGRQMAETTHSWLPHATHAITDGSATSFGPASERELGPRDADEHGLVFFSVERQVPLKPPFPVTPHGCAWIAKEDGVPTGTEHSHVEITDRLRQWVAENQVDFVFRFQTNGIWCFNSLGNRTRSIRDFSQPEQFGTITPAEAAASLDAPMEKDGRYVTSVGCAFGYDQPYRNMLAFRTRKGALSILQWSGIGVPPQTLKIRYKLTGQITATTPNMPERELVKRALATIQDFADGNTADVMARLAPSLRNRWPEEQVRQWWQSLTDGQNNFVRVDGTPLAEPGLGNTRCVTVPCEFAHIRCGIRISFLPDGEIEGIKPLPQGTDENANPSPAVPSASQSDPRQFSAVMSFINFTGSGPNDGLVGDAGPTGKVTCGHPGAVSDVSWSWLRTTEQGDVYRFTRIYPHDTPTAKTVVKEITYTGSPLVVWEDAVHRIGLRPSPRLQFRLVADAKESADAIFSRDGKEQFRLRHDVLLDESAVASAAVTNTAQGPVIEVKFTTDGGKRFADITGASINRRLAIVFDGKVLSAATIRDTITGGRAQITGNFTSAEAGAIAQALNANGKSPESGQP